MGFDTIKINLVSILNVKIHATFVEGSWPEFYAHGRFMK